MIKNMVRAAGLTALAFLVTVLTAGCGNTTNGSNDDVLYELAGRWYSRDSPYSFAFEITETGEGYIAHSQTYCAVSVLGNLVYFRSHGYSMGSFRYSVKNGELTMTLGTGDFSGVQATFIKSGTTPPGGAIPVEFIGTWYAKSNPPLSPNFEITTSGAMTISGSPTSYTAVVRGNKISVLDGSVLKGDFQYSFSCGEMIVTNGTDICAGLAVLSPFVK